jgi:hypothetical protein
MDRGGQSGRGDDVGRGGRRTDGAVRLGEIARQVMSGRITPQQARFGGVADAWSEIVPQELYEHCEIVDLTGGELKVKVDSSAYMYELQLCGSELLEELRRQCPRARLKGIKFVAG